MITDKAGIFRFHQQKQMEFFHAMYPKSTEFLHFSDTAVQHLSIIQGI